MKKIFITLVMLVMGGEWASAQGTLNPDVPLSLPTAAPEFSSWTTSLTYADMKDDTARQSQYQAAMAKLATEDPLLAKALAKGNGSGFVPRVKNITVVKTKDIEHQTVTFLSGQSEESWKSAAARAARSPLTSKIEYHSSAVEGLNFPELKWVTAKDFKQARKIQEVDCLVFRGKVARMQIENPFLVELAALETIPDTEVEVVVNAKTHLPVSVETDEIKRTYTFHPPPAAMLNFPEEFASVVRRAEAKLRARLAPLSSP